MTESIQKNESVISRWAKDVREGFTAVGEAMTALSPSAPPQQRTLDLYRQLPPSKQEDLMRAYREHLTPGGSPVGVPEDYFDRLVRAYHRSVTNPLGMQGGVTPETADVMAAPGNLEISPSADAMDKNTIDIAAAYRRMYQDTDKHSAESFALKAKLLSGERDEIARSIEQNLKGHADYVKAKNTLDQWYAEQQRKLHNEEAIASNDFAAGFSARIEQMRDDLGGLGQLGANVAETGINGLADALSDAALQARTFDDAIRELGMDIAKMAMQWAIKQALTTGLSALFPTKSAAKGGVFDRSGIVPFGSGGVVDRPTLFPFSRGTGLMGEAGPEAVLPLRRDGQGKLGVTAAGGRSEDLLGQILDALRAQQAGGPAVIDDETLNAWTNSTHGRQAIIRVVRRYG